MTSYNYNRFKSTSIFGKFQNSDTPDNSEQAEATFDRNIILKGDIFDASNNLIYAKLSQLSNYVLNSSLSSTLSNYITNASLTTTLNNYALLNSPTFIGTPQTTTPNTGTNNTTRIPTTAWCQSYFANLSSNNVFTGINYLSAGLAVNKSSSYNSTYSVDCNGSINSTNLFVNGSNINSLYAPLTPTQNLYSTSTNLGQNTALQNNLSIVFVDVGTPTSLTLTLPRANNNIGIRITILNLCVFSLTIQTTAGTFRGSQNANSSFQISTNQSSSLIGYSNGQALGFFWFVI